MDNERFAAMGMTSSEIDVIKQEEVEELLQIFLEYCSYGSSYYSEELSDSRFVRFCRDMGILGPTPGSRGLLPQLDVDLIFIQAKPKYYKKMSFECFCKALYLLSGKLGVGFPDLMQQTIEMGGPRPTERAARTYLNAEAPVFAMDTRIRGHEVSDNPHQKVLTLQEMVRPEFVPKPARKPKASPPPEAPSLHTANRKSRASARHDPPPLNHDIDVLTEMSRRAKARSGMGSWMLGQTAHPSHPSPLTPPTSVLPQSQLTPPAGRRRSMAAVGSSGGGISSFEAALKQHEQRRREHEHWNHRGSSYNEEADENEYEAARQLRSPRHPVSVSTNVGLKGSKTPEQKMIGRYKDPSEVSLNPSTAPRQDNSNVYMRLLGSYRS